MFNTVEIFSCSLQKLRINFVSDVYSLVALLILLFGFLGLLFIAIAKGFNNYIKFVFRLSHILRFSQKILVFIMIGSLSFFVFTPMQTFATYSSDLKNKETIIHSNDTGVLLLDRNGKPFFKLYKTKYKEYISINDIPISLQEALIASEDKDFYSHSGFSVKAIARSLLADLKSGSLNQGGSTLTQQLVKNSLLSSERNFYRKFQEILLSQEIESRYSKKDILEMYLNTVYFGNGAYGIEQASQTYFGRHAKDLTLGQASFLISLLPSPSRLSPYSGGVDEAKQRQEYILTQMQKDGYISDQDVKKGLEEKLVFNPNDNFVFSAPHFALMVQDELVKKYGEDYVKNSGFTVKTTLDLSLQDYTQKVVEDQVKNLKYNNVSNGAAVVIDPKTGEILALVGSSDWNNPQFGKLNVVTAQRQTGSAFKPIVYATALEQGVITPATILKDVPTTFPGNYKPLDYDKKFRGNVTARRALSNSLNIPSVQVLTMVGVDSVVEKAKNLGINEFNKDPNNYGLTIVLGTQEISLLELTSAYATFANSGERNDPVTILEIRNKKGDLVYNYSPSPKSVFAPQVTFILSSILSDNKTRSEEFGNLLDISRTAAVKTGTSENYRDSLTLGYTPSIAVGVWVGNNDGAPMDNVAGSLGAAPIWKSVMEHILTDKPAESFTQPENVISEYVCPWAGLPLKDQSGTSGYKEYFISGTDPVSYCPANPVATQSASVVSQAPLP